MDRVKLLDHCIYLSEVTATSIADNLNFCSGHPGKTTPGSHRYYQLEKDLREAKERIDALKAWRDELTSSGPRKEPL